MEIKKVDHLGIVAGVIKDLGIIETIDKLIGTDEQEIITTGEAIAGMIINGLGFASRSMSLTPQFFETKALDILLRKGVEAKHLNRFKLGRSLDKVYDYGCEKLFSSVAINVCRKEKIDISFVHGDTTTFSLDGEYDVDIDSQPVKIVRGYSKDKRPDLKQVVLELMCSQDGGIPLLSKTWNGNESDSCILRERVKNFFKVFKNEKKLRCFIADSKVYNKKNGSYLKQINFITRIPSTVKLENEFIDKAINGKNDWKKINEKNKTKVFFVSHYGIKQRWVVVYSQSAHNRASKSIKKNVDREKQAIKKVINQLRKQKFACKKDAMTALNNSTKKLFYHQIQGINIKECKSYDKPGRPTKESLKIEYQVEATVSDLKKIIDIKIEQKSCFIIATNILNDDLLSDDKIVDAYKGQDCVEKGFAFLKNPTFFVSSLFVKSVSRIQGLLTIMTLSLLIYSIAQRRLRKQLKLLNKTVPNQIKQSTQKPTMKWIFQLFEGIYFVIVSSGNVIKRLIEGLNELRISVIKLLGAAVKEIYNLI